MAYNANFISTPMGGNELLNLSASAVVNLANPTATCVIPFGVQSIETDKYMAVVTSMLGSELINQLAAAAVDQMKVPNYSQYNGVYDVSFARLMGVYASWTRGQKVADYFIIGKEDVYNLLASDTAIQERVVNAVLKANGFADAKGNNGIPLLQLGSVLVPDKKSFEGQLPAGSDLKDSTEVPPPPTGFDVVGAKEADGYSKWWMVGGVAAAGVAAYGVVRMMKKGRRA